MNKNFIRIIPKLDIKNGQLIKGINLEGLRILGDPFNFANFYYNSGADEICYVDNVATLYGTNNISKFISRTAKNIFIPLTVGGGIRTIQDIERILNSGADKVCINSAAIENINFIKQSSKIFGSSNITAIVECIRINDQYYISKSNGRDLANIHPVDWAKRLEDKGVGEIFLTSVNYEGLKSGFDIDITKQISRALSIPVIAHGGAGNCEDIYNIIKKTEISGVAISSILHYGIANLFKFKKPNIGNTFFLKNIKNKSVKKINLIKKIKQYLFNRGINVRVHK